MRGITLAPRFATALHISDSNYSSLSSKDGLISFSRRVEISPSEVIMTGPLMLMVICDEVYCLGAAAFFYFYVLGLLDVLITLAADSSSN